jgi:hypothetical protein
VVWYYQVRARGARLPRARVPALPSAPPRGA